MGIPGAVGLVKARLALATARARMPMAGTFTVAGDSLPNGGYAGNSFVTRLVHKSGGRYRNFGNYAVGGRMTNEILASQVPLAIANPKGALVLFNGGTNDISQGLRLDGTTGASPAVGEATARANVQKIVAAILASGKAPISLGMFPANTANVVYHANHELWRILWCARNNVPHIHAWPSLAQANGNYATGLNLDTVHPNSVGADLAALAGIAQLDRPWALVPFGELIDRSGGILPNAVSFGGVGASLPSGYFSQGSGATYSVEAPTDGSFGNWLTTTYTSAVNLVGWVATPSNAASSGFNIGDRVAVGFRLQTVAAGEQTLKPRISISGLTMDYGQADGDPVGKQPILFDDYSGAAGEDMWVYCEGKILAGTNINLSVQATTTGSTTQKLRIQRPIIYNLTANGLA